MTADTVFESMRGRHVVAVEAIDALAYSRPWSNRMWRTELTEPGRNHLVARIGHTVVGHAGGLRVLDELHVTTVAVHPDREGQGIATRLVIRLLCDARDAGATAATLEVRATHRRTQRLYGRLGFAPAGIRPGYYSEPSDDAVVMWLHDLGSRESEDRIRALDARLDTSTPRGVTP